MIQGKQRLFAVVLLASLALNLFLGGILVGEYVGNVFEPSFPPFKGGKFFWMLQDLPKESREKVRPLIAEHRTRIRPQMQLVKQARHAVHQQLIAINFDKKALTETFVILQQESIKARNIMHTNLIEIASQLNTEDRQKLSKTFIRKPHRRRGKRHWEDTPRLENPKPVLPYSFSDK